MRTKKQQQFRLVVAIALGLACTVVLALVIAVAPWRTFDRDTLCPDHGDYARTVVLVDATDSLRQSQQKAVIGWMQALPRRLDMHELVSVFVLSEENLNLAKPEIELCYPGDESRANRLVENPRRMQQRFEKKFQGPMAAAIERLAMTSPQRTSPIHEMLQVVALYPNFDATKKRRLIVVSDMIQHAPPAYSQYSDGMDFFGWKDSAHGRDVPGYALSGVDVTILYLKRREEHAKRVQKRAHIEFWKEYFSELGASVARVKQLR